MKDEELKELVINLDGEILREYLGERLGVYNTHIESIGVHKYVEKLLDIEYWMEHTSDYSFIKDKFLALKILVGETYSLTNLEIKLGLWERVI